MNLRTTHLGSGPIALWSGLKARSGSSDSAVTAEPEASATDWKWIVLAAGLLLSVTVWTLLSRKFIYGEGHVDRPILEFLAAYGAAWLFFAISALRLESGRRPSFRFIILVAVLARLLLFPSGLIQENDVYRYVLDGNVLIRGENPFHWSPGEVTIEAGGCLAEALDSPEARQVLSRISYSHIPTVYPPAAQAVFALGALVGGWDWLGQRTVFTVLDLAAILLLAGLLERLGSGSRRVLLYAWNPLVLKEIVNSAHFDVLPALSLLLMVWVLFGRRKSLALTAVLTSGCFALGILSKIYPLILVPWVVSIFRSKSERWGPVLLLLGLTSLFTGAAWLPFVGIGLESLAEGFRAYAAQWRMNEGAFALFEFLFPGEARFAAAGLIGLAAALVPWTGKTGASPEERVEQAVWILLLWFLLIPTPYPWYSVPIVALAVLSRRFVLLVVVLSGALSLYYLRFWVEYHHHPDEWWAWARAVEHSLIWLTAGATTLSSSLRRRRSRSSP